jgi:hypothetical protein
VGKIKNFIIQALDNNEDPVYSLSQLKKFKQEQIIYNEKEKSKKEEPSSKGSFDKPFV